MNSSKGSSDGSFQASFNNRSINIYTCKRVNCIPFKPITYQIDYNCQKKIQYSAGKMSYSQPTLAIKKLPCLKSKAGGKHVEGKFEWITTNTICLKMASMATRTCFSKNYIDKKVDEWTKLFANSCTKISSPFSRKNSNTPLFSEGKS